MSRFNMLVVLMLVLLTSTATAAELPINVYRQTDPAWSGDRMGNGGTIGQQGCMMTSVAMALRVTPKDLNNFLNRNNGYAGGGDLRHGVAAAFDGPGGLQYVGTGTLPANAAAVDRGIARGGVYIVRSWRFSWHWCLVFKSNGLQSYYVDPWDGTVRRVGDGWVNYSNETRIYVK